MHKLKLFNYKSNTCPLLKERGVGEEGRAREERRTEGRKGEREKENKKENYTVVILPVPVITMNLYHPRYFSENIYFVKQMGSFFPPLFIPVTT